MKKLIVQHKGLLTLLLFLVASLISIYLTELNGHIWSFLTMSNDGRFHIMRIEGLAQAIRQGNLTPIVNMSFLGGLGYISNVFYSNLWLYPAAVLRLMGLTITQAFVSFYVLLNFATFLTSFGAFYKASQRYDKSLLFSFVYTLSTYRIFDMVRRFDVGELSTFVFLPIVVLGVYEIFYNNRHQWIYLTIGMVGVIYSHALSPVLIGIFIVLVMIFRIKTLVKEPQRILALFYAGVSSLMLGLAYFMPMLEQMRHTQFKLTNVPLINVSQTEMSWPDLLNWSVHNDLYKQNIGLIMLVTAIMIPLIIWKIKNVAIRDFAIIGELLLVMTTNIFPWKFFDKTPLNMIQFPWRFYMIVSILFAIVIAADPLGIFSGNWKKVMMILFALGLVVNSERILVQQYPREDDAYTQFNHLDVDSIGSGQEYLPKNASLTALIKAPHTPQVLSGQAKISNFSQVGSKVTFHFRAAQNAKVSVPIICYYGYSAKDSTGQVSKLRMDKNNNGLGQIIVNDKGVVRIDYEKTPFQRISKVISLASLFLGLMYFARKKFKK